MSSATTPTVVSIATMPTSMTDAEATRLGLKTYSHGVTYTGSPNSPTLTLSAGGGTLNSVSYSRFIPYQMQDGSWRLRVNFQVALSGQARTSATITIAGVNFSAAGGDGQTLAGGITNSANNVLTYVPNNGTSFNFAYASATSDGHWMSGDIALAAKPTWAF